MGAHVSVPMYHRTLEQRLRLAGVRCEACGVVTFPPRGPCRGCGSRSLVTVEIAGTGVIAALTAISLPAAPPEFAEHARRSGGYEVAIVALDAGPLVTGQLVPDGGGYAIGDRVEAVTRRLYEEEGVVRYGFKFCRPRDRDPR